MILQPSTREIPKTSRPQTGRYRIRQFIYYSDNSCGSSMDPEDPLTQPSKIMFAHIQNVPIHYQQHNSMILSTKVRWIQYSWCIVKYYLIKQISILK